MVYVFKEWEVEDSLFTAHEKFKGCLQSGRKTL
jgi:hypothetical protein